MPDTAPCATMAADPVLRTGLNAARAAADAGDLADALATYAALRGTFPGSTEPYLHAAAALTRRHHDAEAGILLEAAVERFPTDPAVAAAFAGNVQGRGALTAATRLWEHARQLTPQDPIPSIALARLAQARGDLVGCLALWRGLRERFPAVCQVVTGEAEALLASARIDEAEAILSEALAHYPDDAEPLMLHAKVAVARRDWAAAAKRWALVRERFPNRAEGYAGQVAVWRDLGQFDAADAVASEGLLRFPDDPGLLSAFAAVAYAKRDWPVAAARWAQARSRLSGHVGVFVDSVVTLRAAGRFGEAEALAIEAQRRFPAHPAPAMAFADTAMARGDGPAATVRWDKARARFPDAIEVWLGSAACLRQQDRHADAEATLAQAAPRFPWHFAPVTGEGVPLALPAVVRSGPVRVAVAGYHLANQISLLFGRTIPFRDRVDVRWIDVGLDTDGIRRQLPDLWLDGADVYFEEAMVGDAGTKRGVRNLLPSRCQASTFPTSSFHALWPFYGQDRRLGPEPPFYPGGRYAYPDGVAAALADPAIADDVLFDMYMEITEAAPLDLEMLRQIDLTRLRAEDGHCDVQLTPFVEAHFRDRRMFATPHERAAPIVLEIARQLLATPLLREVCSLETALAGLDRLTMGWRAHARALPVHPRVARSFGLTWWSPDMLYELGHTSLTFREYTIRYLRWSPWLV